MFLDRSSRREPAPAKPTYRHLLSPTAQTPSNPLRVVAHCDIDAAYAQFEAVRIGSPDHVPLIVVQWETIIAVNYPARKFGIKRCSTMGPKEARELCPDVVIVHTATYRPGETESGYWEDANVLTHKVSLDPYRKESAKVIAIFRELVPRGVVQKASIDEAYMDLTPLVIERMVDLHPHLVDIPLDAPDGIDSVLPPAPPIDWSLAGHVIPVTDEDVECSDIELSDDGLGHVHGRKEELAMPSWSDWALCIGAEIMGEVRKEIWKRLHYTCSAGIAHNKAMAKLCSSWKKPNGQTVLRHAAVQSFLRDQPFTDIRNLGGKLGRAVAAEFKAETVGELSRVSLSAMQSRFGEESIWIYNLIRGIDETEVTSFSANKTMLASKNLIPPCTTPQEGYRWIDLLAGELSVRLLEAREVAPNLWPRTIVLSWRTGYGYGNNLRSRQMPFGYTKRLDADYIGKYGKKLWEGACPGIVRAKGGMDVHSLSLTFAGVERMEHGQRNIEGFLGIGKRERSVSVEPKRSLSIESEQPIHAGPSRRRSSSPIEPQLETLEWECPRCERPVGYAADRPLEEAKQEHEDYHYALELSHAEQVPGKGPKKRKKETGIKAFFKVKDG
ncbi:hypothetical protein BCR39DRAFT_551866 [Naematelia encephala]|uniref:DNA polymerase eta n=1 Tax=Naematelia encephala TaxID=71784 RepID=A0A1Y2AI26_9TREE|nr:hypothetical protein BCR39DRAFT_551866 [Naematelia encephala]